MGGTIPHLEGLFWEPHVKPRTSLGLGLVPFYSETTVFPCSSINTPGFGAFGLDLT